MKIVLLRHGLTNLSPWPWIRACELGRWIAAYNRAGIQDMPPSAAAMAVAGQCKVIVTSDLVRSVESGRVLGAGTPMMSEGLFREAGLPYGSTAFIKMPPFVWAMLFRFLWSFGFKTKGESIHAFRKRAQRGDAFDFSGARTWFRTF